MTIEPPPVEESTWRNRFIILNLTRIGGTIVVLIGLAIWHGDLYRQGGAIEIGLPLALIGLAISFLLPKRLAQQWKTPPAP
jgi:hypothetical protein